MNIIKNLEKYNITLEDIINCGMELCISEDTEKEIIRKKLEKTIVEMLNNPNVSTLIIGAIKLDEEGIDGNLPFDYDNDQILQIVC